MKVFEKADTMNYGTAIEITEYETLAIVGCPSNFEGFISDEDEQPAKDEFVSVEEAEKFLSGELNYRSDFILVGECDGMWVNLVASLED